MKKIVLGFVVLLIVSGLFAGSFEETMDDLSGDAAKCYVSPLVSAFGTNMNGGWFHSVPKKSILGLNVELGIVSMLTPFPDDDKHFSTTGDFYLTREQAEDLIEGVSDIPAVQDALIDKLLSEKFTVGISGATIIGDEDDHVLIDFFEKPIEITTVAGMTDVYTIPQHTIDTGVGGKLDDMSALPLFAPQLGVGTVFGTRAYLRYLPSVEIEDLGEFSYWGVGLQHNVKAWIPVPMPIDISLAAFTQRLKIGDIVDAKATTVGLNAGKTFGFRFLSVTPYTGLMYEKSTMEFNYDYEIGENPITNESITQNINFEMDGENEGRLVIGSAFRLGVYYFSADYNIGKYNSITANLGVAF